MKQLIALLLPILMIGCATDHYDSHHGGTLVVVGGGGTPDSVVARAVEIARGDQAVVAIIPHASRRQQRGQKSAAMFLKAGAKEAVVIEDLASRASQAYLARCTLVWMPGGSQNRLLDALRSAELVDPFLRMHRKGVVFGGTSAGAAIQSRLMITGKADLTVITAGNTELATGLGLWPTAIVDQHAVKRCRFTRLLSAVLDHEDQVGVAIDERTAVFVTGPRVEVLGESSVLVIDARDATIAPSAVGTPQAARGIKLHVLRSGMSLELN